MTNLSPNAGDPGGPDPREINSAQEFAAALRLLKERSGRSVGELARLLSAELDDNIAKGTVGGWLGGKHLPTPALVRALPVLARLCGETDPVRAQGWSDAVQRIRRWPGPRPTDGVVPYPGLEPYGPELAAFFHGRDALVDEVVTLLEIDSAGPVIVVGRSGSGKSSLLRAGVIPRLAGVDNYVLCTPGGAPLTTLAKHIAELAGRGVTEFATQLRIDPVASAARVRAAVDTEDGIGLLIVVDQFEEIFTMCPDDGERRAFVSALCALSEDGPGIAVALALRADFYEPSLDVPQLRTLLQRSQVPMRPMTETELRAAITKPAGVARLNLEPGLVEVLVAEFAPTDVRRADGAGHEAGALPLLSYALAETCALAGRRRITVDDYRLTGGIRHALSNAADRVYEELDSDALRALARHLFLRLTLITEETATRRRVRLAELVDGRPASEAADLRRVLEAFIAARLIATDAELGASDGAALVEITHEALLSNWDRFSEWLAADRVGLRIRLLVELAARDWQDSGRRDGDLYPSGKLAGIREWLAEAGHRERLTTVENEFLAASLDRERREERQARLRVRHRYQIMAALLALVLVSAGVTAYATQLRANDRSDRDMAAANSAQALSRTVADEADRLREKDVPLSMQLALAAYRIWPTTEARSSLLNSTDEPAVTRLADPAGKTASITLARNATLLAAGSDSGTAQLWTTSAPGRFTARAALPGAGAQVALSGNGNTLATGGADGRVRLWDTTDPAHPVALGVLTGPTAAIATLAISADGATVAAISADRHVYVWSPRAATAAPPLAEPALTNTALLNPALAFTPDGRTLAVGGEDEVRRWDVRDPVDPVALPPLTGPASHVFALAVSPDGRYLAAGVAAQHEVFLWDISDPAHPVSAGVFSGPASWVESVAFSPDSATLGVGSSDDLVWWYDLRTGQVLGKFPHPNPVTGMAFRGPDSMITLADDGTIRSWQFPGPVLPAARDTLFAASFDAAGDRLGVGPGEDDNTVTVWNPTDPDHPVELGPPLVNTPDASRFSGSGALTPDGDTFVVGDVDGSIQLWDIHDPAHPARIGAPIPAAGDLVESVSLSNDGKLLMVGADDGTTRLFDFSDPHHLVPLAVLSVPRSGPIYQATTNPADTLLAMAADNGKVYLFDIRDRGNPRLLATLSHFTAAAYAVAFSHDGTLLAAGSADDTVEVWRVGSGRPVAVGGTLTGQVGYVYSVAFNPGRDILATGSTDNTVSLWDLTQPERPSRLATLTGSTDGVLVVAYSPDGRTLAAGGHDRTLRMWDTDPAAAAQWICATAGYPITRAEWSTYVPGQPYDPPCR